MNTRDTLYTEVGVNADWRPTLPKGWAGSRSAFLAAGDPKLQRELIGMLSSPRTTMVDTILFYINGSPDALRTTMATADYVCINDSEARMLANTPSVARAARTLIAAGTKAIVIKLGEFGAIYQGPAGYFVAPGYPLEEVVDPTGAGDAFAGGFMGYLDSLETITNEDVRRAVLYGSTVASFVVEGIGLTRLLTLTRGEVERRYREFRALTHVEVGE
jgi:sugar/nucleoside kinase (ribokinase family)